MADILTYLRTAVGNILSYAGIGADGRAFTGGLGPQRPFRPTQREAVTAYGAFLDGPLSESEKKSGYFEIATGVGKTGIFLALVYQAHLEAERQQRKNFRSMIVVPTTQLLGQTYDEFIELMPDMADKIGLYGDDHKDLGKPVTLITYDSWIALTEAGKINQDNVDLLISDEAHRGTSDRRVEQLLKAFGDKTVRLAFTATAHFDENKSVQKSHKHEIFYKSLPDSVRAGELADYIHSQLYVIRVAPSEKHETEPTSDQRRTAWNKRVTRIFGNGLDHITGEPLCDNQSAFYVSDTAHADQLEAMLNADPLLKQKAAAQGKAGIAVAIHSKLSPREQKTRLRDFMDGKYMAIVGDQKFKEGFDHPALKNIFDFPRGSLVDKAQILGRAGRKWWNALKARFEGMSFIDTVVYVGSADPEEDERRRKLALRNSVLVSSILEGTEIFAQNSPFAGPGARPRSSGSSAFRVFADDENVEEYATLEDVRNIHAQITYLRRENIIDLTPAHIEWLEEQRQRTGLGPISLIRAMGEDCPQNLTASVISAWLSRTVKTAREEHWNALKDFVEAQLDAEATHRISDEDRAWINQQVKRTRMGAKSIIIALDDQCPEDLTARRIVSWQTGTMKNASSEQWNTVRDFLLEQPDADPIFNISDTDRAYLDAEMERTGMSAYSLLKQTGDATPEGLTKGVIDNWRSGKVQTARISQWEFVHAALQIQPDIKYVTAQDREWLGAKMESTAFAAQAIITGLGATAPEGLTRGMIEAWRDGESRKASPSHWLAVKNFLDAQSEPKRLCDADRLWLEQQMTRTNLRPMALATAMGCKDITDAMITGWLLGTTVNVDPARWEKLQTFFAKRPDIKFISATDRDWLNAQIERTKLGQAAILAGLGSKKPEHLTKGMIAAWQSGGSATAELAHWTLVQNYLVQQPDGQKIHVISPAEITWLKEQMELTGLGTTLIITALGAQKPEGMNVAMLNNWLTGTSLSTKQAYWTSVQTLFAGYDRLKAADIERLSDLQKRSGIKLKDVFERSGLQPSCRITGRNYLSGIFSGKVSALHPEDRAAIEQAYASLKDGPP